MSLILQAEFFVFGGCRRVIGKHIDALHTCASGNKDPHGPDIFFIIIDAWNKRQAYSYRKAFFRQCLQIMQNQVVGNASVDLVFPVVHVFDIN